jgi:hypothetical protein
LKPIEFAEQLYLPSLLVTAVLLVLAGSLLLRVCPVLRVKEGFLFGGSVLGKLGKQFHCPVNRHSMLSGFLEKGVFVQGVALSGG